MRGPAVCDLRPATHTAAGHHTVWGTRAGGKADVQDSIGSPALAMAWHPGGTRLGVARRNGKISIYDIRKLGSKARAVCEETLTWELNKFLFVGGGDTLVASYGHQQRGGFRVLKVRTWRVLLCTTTLVILHRTCARSSGRGNAPVLLNAMRCL